MLIDSLNGDLSKNGKKKKLERKRERKKERKNINFSFFLAK